MFDTDCLSVFQKHHDIWNTVNTLCVFFSNQEILVVSFAQWSVTFVSCASLPQNNLD